MSPFLAVATETSPLLRDLVVILAAAAVVAVGLQRLKLATIPAYLITGALIGPGALGFVRAGESVEAVSNLAIVLLLFGVGLHMDLAVLARGFRQMLSATLLSFTLCTLAFWIPCRLIAGDAAGALVVSAALSFSSTVVVLRLLMDRRELTHPEGRLAFGVLIIQDLLAVVLLLLLPPLARWKGTGEAAPAGEESGVFLSLVTNGLLAVGGIGAIVAIGRYMLPRLLSEAARHKSSEVLVVISTAAALGAAGLTQKLFNNPAIGAFLAGFLLSSTPFRHQLGGQVGAVRDLFSAVFFTSIGMTVSLSVVAGHWAVVLGGAAVVLAAKTAMMAVAFWLTGATGNVALKAGFALAQAGEFGVLLLVSAGAPGVALISREAVGATVAIIVLTLIATPEVLQLGAATNRRLPRIPAPEWKRRREARRAALKALQPGGLDDSITSDWRGPGSRPLHAIVAGFGLVGRAVTDELKRLGATFTIVDLNMETLRTQTRLGRPIVFGDVSNEEVLESAGVHRAELLVLTIPDEESVLRACRVARRMKPDIFIIARTNYVSQGVVAAGMGADGVVVEEMATAKEMERVIEKLMERKSREAVRV